MFFTCCIFHNLLLTFDGLDARWEKDINYAGIDGEHAAEVSDHLILSRYVCSNIVANIVTNIYMYVMRHVRT